VTAVVAGEVYYDPYDVKIEENPYPVYRLLRDKAPVYHNTKYDFYVLSRYEDVERGLVDHRTFTSGRGATLDSLKAGLPIPPGTLIFEDPPLHTSHRRLLSRVFTPTKISALEPLIRQYCADALDPVVGTGQFDFVRDLGRQMPMRVIGMLLGVPPEDQERIRDGVEADPNVEPGKPRDYVEGSIGSGAAFADYIDWRAEHPSDDLMTELLNAEFHDEKGTLRRLTRQEVGTYVSIVNGAGNETTGKLLGWAGKVLAEHPDQRAELVEDSSLIPKAIEELLRFEPPAHHVGRYVARDLGLHGETVPEGSTMVFLTGSANRDERRFADPDRFDIHRDVGSHLAFGYGPHFCLGAALARLEGRIALEEVLRRFPRWELDYGNMRMAAPENVRGWVAMPTFVR
jgi:cytochrome P450